MMPMMAQRLIPPVPYYKTGFEEMETQTFVDDTVEIEGVRWRIVNGRIVDDPKANIPFGKKALELTAGYVGDVPAMIEALDPIRGTQVSVSYMQGWTDALVSNAGKSWFAQESFDGGKSWGEKELIFDATTISTDLYERIDPDADSFRFRIIFNDPDKTKGVGWRIMLDNIAFYDTGEGAPIRTPWSVYPADIRNGFETAQSTLSYHILAFGDDWIMGDPQRGVVRQFLHRGASRRPARYAALATQLGRLADYLQQLAAWRAYHRATLYGYSYGAALPRAGGACDLLHGQGVYTATLTGGATTGSRGRLLRGDL